MSGTGGTTRSLDLWDTLNNLQVASQPDITTPLVAVDDYVTVTDPMTLADSVALLNTAHTGTYLYDDATSIYGLAQYS